MSSSQSQRLAATKSALVDSGRTLILNGGLKAVTMSAVADVSGLSRATVYNHIRSKHELLQLVFDDFYRRLLEVARSKDSARAGLVAVSQAIAHDDVVHGIRMHNPELLVSGLQWSTTFSDNLAVDVIEILGAWHVHADLSAAEAVIRWLSSFASVPGTDADREVGADIVAMTLSLDVVR